MVNRIHQLVDSLSSIYKPPAFPVRQLHDPILADIAMFPEIRAIVELPNEAQVTFKSVFDDLPSMVARWHAKLKTQLGEELKCSFRKLSLDGHAAWSEGELEDGEASTLVDLAVSLFRCRKCHRDLIYPSLISHYCERRAAGSSDVYLHTVLVVAGCCPWSPENIDCYTTAYAVTLLRAITNLIGLDWKTVTCKEMDECEERFICTCSLCADSVASPPVMTWRHVVNSLVVQTCLANTDIQT